MPKRPTINFGDKCKDIVTGFVGICTARSEFINGCVQILLAPKLTKSGDKPNSEWFDIERLKVEKKNAVKLAAEPSGGASGADEAPPVR